MTSETTVSPFGDRTWFMPTIGTSV
jgi:hypothetical protein